MLHVPSALFYGFISTFMVFGNKYLLSVWSFRYPITLILLEMSLNMICISFYNAKFKSPSKSIKFSPSNVNLNTDGNNNQNSIKITMSPEPEPESRSTKRLYHILTAVAYSAHSVTSLKALSSMNIPMYVIFKRMVPLVNLLLSFVLFNDNSNGSSSSANSHASKMHSRKIYLSISIMTLGVVIAGAGDIGFDPRAYFYCGFSVVCQALYFSFIQKCGETSKNPFENLYRMATYSFPILFVFFLLGDEMSDLVIEQKYKYLSDGHFWMVLFMLIPVGTMLSFSQFWCTINNNAVTTSVVGVLKSVIQTLFGFIFFDGYNNLSFLTLTGITINLVFGTWVSLLTQPPFGYHHSKT